MWDSHNLGQVCHNLTLSGLKMASGLRIYPSSSFKL